MSNTIKAVTPVSKQSKAAKAKPAKQATPAAKPEAKDTAKAQAQADRIATLTAARVIARTHYDGPSMSVHGSNRNVNLAKYLAVVASPTHRAASESTRDGSFLAVAFKHCDAKGTFNPCDFVADLGIVSRLASLNYVKVQGERIAFTEVGLARAKAMAAKQ